MEAFLTSTAVVALAEIGDKTQLLAMLLATRLKRPVPIIFGILAATIANHFLAALVGVEAASILDGLWFRIIIGASFIVMGLWTLIPDTFDENKGPRSGSSAFFTTFVAFFFVEMGDKTQLATIALGARFQALLPVTLGTTSGMMIANIPAVLLGDQLLKRVPLRYVRWTAALLFVAIGVWILTELAVKG